MKLFYSAGACSLSPHIVAHEAGIDLKLQKVDTATKTMKVEGDFWEVNPKGYVPALELDNGEILTEGPAIVQYLADLKPKTKLAPQNGTWERIRLQEMLGYINSEIHKTFSPLFNSKVSAEVRKERTEYLTKRYALLDKQLAGKKFLFGDQFTIADAYLFVVTNFAKATKVDLSSFTNLQSFQKRVAARPAVQAAMTAEGIIPAAKAA
ncbi:MAG: glutathione transferase GstA [Steroidobacteraceae bacterium]